MLYLYVLQVLNIDMMTFDYVMTLNQVIFSTPVDEIVCSVIVHHLIITVSQVDILAMNRTIFVPIAFVLMRMHQLSLHLTQLTFLSLSLLLL